jgi:hypothetical protein
MLIIIRKRESGRGMSENFGEALTLPLLRAHVKLLALIDVKKKAGRLGLVEFLATIRSPSVALPPCRASIHRAGVSPARGRLPRIARCRGTFPPAP